MPTLARFTTVVCNTRACNPSLCAPYSCCVHYVAQRHHLHGKSGLLMPACVSAKSCVHARPRQRQRPRQQQRQRGRHPAPARLPQVQHTRHATVTCGLRPLPLPPCPHQHPHLHPARWPRIPRPRVRRHMQPRSWTASCGCWKQPGLRHGTTGGVCSLQVHWPGGSTKSRQKMPHCA